MTLAALPQKKVIATYTDMFSMAANYFNDATQWNRIASSNTLRNSDGFVDPFIDAMTTVIVPPVDKARGNGGIYRG